MADSHRPRRAEYPIGLGKREPEFIAEARCKIIVRGAYQVLKMTRTGRDAADPLRVVDLRKPLICEGVGS